jgi:hypothetical protein
MHCLCMLQNLRRCYSSFVVNLTDTNARTDSHTYLTMQSKMMPRSKCDGSCRKFSVCMKRREYVMSRLRSFSEVIDGVYLHQAQNKGGGIAKVSHEKYPMLILPSCQPCLLCACMHACTYARLLDSI